MTKSWFLSLIVIFVCKCFLNINLLSQQGDFGTRLPCLGKSGRSQIFRSFRATWRPGNKVGHFSWLRRKNIPQGLSLGSTEMGTLLMVVEERSLMLSFQGRDVYQVGLVVNMRIIFEHLLRRHPLWRWRKLDPWLLQGDQPDPGESPVQPLVMVMVTMDPPRSTSGSTIVYNNHLISPGCSSRDWSQPRSWTFQRARSHHVSKLWRIQVDGWMCTMVHSLYKLSCFQAMKETGLYQSSKLRKFTSSTKKKQDRDKNQNYKLQQMTQFSVFAESSQANKQWFAKYSYSFRIVDDFVTWSENQKN